MSTVLPSDATRPAVSEPSLPASRGPISEVVIDALRGEPGPVPVPVVGDVDPLTDDDLQLALYCAYELHYRGFAGVDPRWEWWPSLLEARRHLEDAFEQRLLDTVTTQGPASGSDDPRGALRAIVDQAATAPSLSAYVAAGGTVEQVRELCVHRSAYQLKEADPHTWAIPRLAGDAKAAMVAIQVDEYGGGYQPAMHSTLFADTMAELGLDTRYGAYLDVLPGTTLATVNLVSLFGLHRRWRGALVGHLALFEMTSVTPMARYGEALARLGFGPLARRFYDVHVEADVEHEGIALDRMVTGLVADEPELAADVVFGARAVLAVEAGFSGAVLEAWSAGRTSLLDAAR